jgi:hypothetical protein
MKEMVIVMNRASESTCPLSNMFSGDAIASARRLQEYVRVVVLVDFLWRHQQEHTNIWKSYTQADAKQSQSEKVQEFASQAGRINLSSSYRYLRRRTRI